MKNFWGSFLGAIAGTVVAGIVASVIVLVGLALIIGSLVSSGTSKSEIEISKNSVLRLKLDYDVNDKTSHDPFSNMDIMSMKSKAQLGLDEMLASIRYAKEDKNITGIYLQLSTLPSGMATLEEIRNALLSFKESGKFIVCYTEYMTQKAYYMATVADEIYLNPAGFMDFKGLSFQLIFFSKTLQKLGLDPEVIRPTGNRFKSAVEPYILDKASEANRLQLEVILNSLWNKVAQDIHNATGKSLDSLDSYANNYTISLASDAMAHQMVTALKYEDEFLTILKQKSGVDSTDEANVVNIEKYAQKVSRHLNKKNKNKIAVIYASGEIVDGEGSRNQIGGEKFVKMIREVRNDESVKAIVLRVNSPGGSAMASELIWHELELAKKQKPLVVSMGNYAASGGYYISCNADTIVADYTTITGSIGVFSIMFSIQKMLNEHLGITVDTVKSHRFSDFPTSSRPFTAEEKNVMQHQVDYIYSLFLQRVADGRHMTVQQVDSIAQGRVWTGADALKLGLVDVLGGIEKAVHIASSMAGLESYQMVTYPLEEDLVENFFKELSGGMAKNMIQNGLKDSYKYYEHLNKATNLTGIQVRMPYTLDVY